MHYVSFNVVSTLRRGLLWTALAASSILGHPPRVRAQSLQWQRTLTPLTEAIAFNPLSKGLVIFAAAKDSEGIYKSYDGGLTWKHLYGGANPLEAGSSAEITQIYVSSRDTGVVIVGSSDVRVGMYRSIDGGYNWKRVLANVSSDGQTIYAAGIGAHDTLYYAESASGHIWHSLDDGATWDSLTAAVNQPALCTVVAGIGNSSLLLAGSAGGTITRSSDAGKTWDTTHHGEPSGNADVPRIVFDAKHAGRVWATVYYYPGESLLRSDDDGRSWSVNSSVPLDEWALELDPANTNRFWIGMFSGLHPALGHVLQTVDGGDHFTSEGLDSVTDIWMLRYDSSSGKLVAATSSGVFVADAGKSSVALFSASRLAAVYPNPAHTHLTISSDAQRAELVDVLGHVRDRWIGDRTTRTRDVNVSDWVNGNYFLVEHTSVGIQVTRLVVQH